MPAQPYSTGPAHLFVGRLTQPQGVNSQGPNSPSAFGPLYIGTAERSPQILIRRGFVPVFNDISGPVVPLDLMYSSQEGFVSYNLTRWNDTNLQVIQAQPSDNSLLGGNVPGDIGTLMLTEGFALDVWVLFPYQQKPAYSQMLAGYHFEGGILVGPDDLNQLGTNPRRIHLLFHCLPAFNGSSFFLFDNEMSLVKGISTV